MDNTEEFTARQAAEYLGYAYNTMNAARHTGILAGREAPKFFRRGRPIRYKKSSLDKWLRVATSAEATKLIKNVGFHPNGDKLYIIDDNSNDIAMEQI